MYTSIDEYVKVSNRFLKVRSIDPEADKLKVSYHRWAEKRNRFLQKNQFWVHTKWALTEAVEQGYPGFPQKTAEFEVAWMERWFKNLSLLPKEDSQKPEKLIESPSILLPEVMHSPEYYDEPKKTAKKYKRSLCRVTGKVKFEGEKAARKNMYKKGARLRVYPCKFCGGYHQTKNIAKRRA